jgi:hypothetical protein
MPRRPLLRWLAVVAGLAAFEVASIGAFAIWFAWPSSISRQQFASIQVGMSQTEVEAVLGPPGDYRSSESADDRSTPQPGDRLGARNFDRYGSLEMWLTDTAYVFVEFDASGKVCSGHFSSYKRSRNDLPYNVTWRVMHRWFQWLL